MIKKKNSRVVMNGTFFKIMLFSYIGSCTALIILSFTINYFVFFPQLKKEIKVSQDLLVSQFEENVNYQIKAMDNISILIKNDADMISSLITNNYDHIKNSRKMSSFVSINQNIIDVCIYDANSQMICSSIGSVSLLDYFELYYKFEDANSGEMINFLNSVNKTTLTNTMQVKSYTNSYKRNVALYIIPISNFKKVFFVIEDSFFYTGTGAYYNERNTGFSIFDTSYNEVFTFNTDKNMKMAVDKLNKFSLSTEKSNTINYHGKFVTMIKSGYNGWIYCLYSNISDYVTRVRISSTVFVVSLFVSLLLGICISIIISGHNYKPVKNLCKKIRNTTGDSLSEKNEISAINSYLQKITDSNVQMAKRLDREHKYILNSIMTFVVNGTADYSANIAAFKDSSYEIIHESLCVITLRIINNAYDLQYVSNLLSIKSASLSNNVVRIIPVFTADDKIHSIIVNAEDFDGIPSVCSELCNAIIDETGDEILFGIGSRYKDTKNIYTSYSRAMIALATPHTQSQINFSSQVNIAYKDHLSIVNDSRVKISKYIQGNDIDGIKTYINEIFNSQINDDLKMVYYTNIISEIIVLCDQYEYQIEDIDIYILQSKFTTADLPKKCVILATELYNHISNVKNQPHNQLKHDIINYIITNISDSNLTCSSIAENFGISVSYLNKYFKSVMGISPTAYLDNKRMSMAVDLILKTDLYIKDIVERVGYCDVNNFIRKFKNEKNMTPLQYRSKYS